MKSEGERGLAGAREHETLVLEYLHEHPDLLVQHPALLAQMHVPHECGKAVSLVEYQVSVLRDQVRDLRRRMHELVANARDNEELSRRMHHLTLTLIECTGADELFAALYHGLSEDFKADVAVVRLFAAPRVAADGRLGEFAGPASVARELFEHVLQGDRPVCGRLKEQQLEYLFGPAGHDTRSGALLPLGDAWRFGLLAIGSRDPRRFHPGMGTVFLRNLAEVVTRVLAPHVMAA